jgi:hypothetical protein
MSSVKTQSRYDASRHINYISTAPFNSNFFKYTYAKASPANSYVGSGALTAVLNTSGSAVTAADCPAGRILRTNGRKLYPDAAGLSLTTYPDRTPLVGVFDYHSGLSGFIDPNATMFALYNVDKPIDAIDGTAASGANNHKGMSVFTGGTITAGGQIRSTTVTVIPPGATASIDGTLGQIFTLAQATTEAMTINCPTAGVPPSGSIVYVIITPAGTGALITWGTNIKGLNVTTVASRVTTCAFVSDGTKLNQFGGITSS